MTEPTELRFPEFVWIWNRLNTNATPAHHLRIARWLGHAWERGDTRLLLMCFRGAGKSTVVGLYCAWLLSQRPELRLMVLSAEQGLATRMVRNVRQIIRRHPFCRHLHPRHGGEWASDRFTVNRQGASREPSMIARGIEGNITGSRADVIICDDVEVPGNSDTAGKRQDLRERLGEIAFILVPGGTTLFIGTPHTPDTIYATEARPGGPAPFLAGFRRLVIPLLDAEGRSAWPDRFSAERIEEVRRRVGPRAFASQMQLEPQPPEDARLDPADLMPYDDELTLHMANNGLRMLLGGRTLVSASAFWDPAFGAPGRGDASVFAAVFTDSEGTRYLHRIAYLTHDPSGTADAATQLCRQVVRLAGELHLPSLTVENNGLGRFLPGLLRSEMARARIPCTVVEKASTRSKADRILAAIEPLLAARRLWAHRSVFATGLVPEMREWRPTGSKGAHDDGLDAVAGAILNEPTRLSRAAPAVRDLDWRPGGGAFRAREDFTP
ncbi:MAG: phage terminase large subunit [Acetobacteraceae bacterium]